MADERFYDLAGRKEETKEKADEKKLFMQMKLVSLDEGKGVKCESCVRGKCPRSYVGSSSDVSSWSVEDELFDESSWSDESELFDESSWSDESELFELLERDRQRHQRERERYQRARQRYQRARQRYQRARQRLYEQKRPRMYERVRQWYENVAVFLCFVCEMYVCAECLPKHRDHNGMKVGRKENEGNGEQREREKNEGVRKKSRRMGLEAERERERAKKERERMRERLHAKGLWDDVMNESETESEVKFKTNKVSIIDRVDVKHKLDRTEYCRITGLCVLENERLIVCDCNNFCIKIFELGSHVIQRYIRFVGSEPGFVGPYSKPYNATEIDLKQNSIEPNLVSGSSSDISVTDRADLDKQCMIAVTLPWKCQIVFIDLSKKPAKTQKIIQTEGECFSIQFYDDKIFTGCRKDHYSLCSVYIYSTDGDTLNKFDNRIYAHVPELAVVSGRVYLTESNNHKVQCRNVEGQVISEIIIEGSQPTGISVDPDNNVYVCAWLHGKVYKLDADLTQYKSLLDQTTDYIEEPIALCYYRDKLFISHQGPQSLSNVVTVVRLL